MLLLKSLETSARILVEYLITGYFINLTSVAVIFNSTGCSPLQREYLDAVQQTFQRSANDNGKFVRLQWLNVAPLNDNQLEEKMLKTVNVVTEGFITILSNTSKFLHARYYATRNAEQRFKDKYYLFLCENEIPKDLLQLEILQFYPHHLMVIPAQTSLSITNTTKQNERYLSRITNRTITRRTTAATTTATFCSPSTASTNTWKTITSNNNRLHSSIVLASIQKHQQVLHHNNRHHYSCPDHHHQYIRYELWTQKFIGDFENVDAVQLDSFEPNDKTFFNNVELYPNKLSNMKGRSLRLGSITYIPYVVTNNVPPGEGNVDPVNPNGPKRSVFYNGSEANLVMTFCQVYNCHLRVVSYGDDNWGAIFENKTSSGMLGDIFNQKIELAVGCIYNWYNNITETSGVIALSAVTILGPTPVLYPAWRTNLMPFNTNLWILLMVTTIICALVLHAIRFSKFSKKHRVPSVCNDFLQRYRSFEQAFFEIFAIFIQQSTPDRGIHSFGSRFFMTTLLLATVTLENTYSGQLKSILAVPFYTEPIDTMQKWSNTPWKWGAPSIAWVQSLKNSDILKEQILTEKFEARNYEFLYNASFRNDYGLGIERLMSRAFSFGRYVTAPALETKLVVKDDLYTDWSRAVSIRGWPLMPLFDRHIRACVETGLFLHWERQMILNYIDRQTHEILMTVAAGYATKSPPQKLTLENVSGAMFALLCGYSIAFVIIPFEILCYSIKKKISKLSK